MSEDKSIDEARKVVESIRKEKILYGELEMLEWMVEEARRYESLLKSYLEQTPKKLEKAKELISNLRMFGEKPDIIVERIVGLMSSLTSHFLWNLAKEYGYHERDEKFIKWFDDYTDIVHIAYNIATLNNIKYQLEKPETKRILGMR